MQINHNIRAMITQHSLYTNNNAMSKSLARLSTGLRINRAQDDAAGLAMSEQMRNQLRGFGKAKQNAGDGIAALQIAEGALGEITNMLQRQKELSVQAANDTLTSTERMYLNDEFQQLTQEIDRIAKTTDYNGKNVLIFDTNENLSFGATKLNPFNREVSFMDSAKILYDSFGAKLNGGLGVVGGDSITNTSISDAEAALRKSEKSVSILQGDVDTIKGVIDSIYEFMKDNGISSSDPYTTDSGITEVLAAATANKNAIDAIVKAVAGDKGLTDLDDGDYDVEEPLSMAVKKDLADLTNTDTAMSNTPGSDAFSIQEFIAALKDDLAVYETELATAKGNVATNKAALATAKEPLNGEIKAVNDAILAVNKVVGDLNGIPLSESNIEEVLGKILRAGDIAGSNTAYTYGGDKVYSNVKYAFSTNMTDDAFFSVSGSDAQAVKEFNQFLRDVKDAYEGYRASEVGNPRYGDDGNILKASIQSMADTLNRIFNSDSADILSPEDTINDLPISLNELTPNTGNYTMLADAANSIIERLNKLIDSNVFVPGDAGTKGTLLDEGVAALGAIFSRTATPQIRDAVAMVLQFDVSKMVDNNGNALPQDNADKQKALSLQKAVQELADAYGNYADERSNPVGTAASEVLHITPNYSRSLGGKEASEIMVNYVAVDVYGLGMESQSIDAQANATRAIDQIDEVIKIISGNRAAIGTYINRLEYTINNIASMEYNTQDAESRIRDTDFSKETTEFTKNQIMVQSATSILAQANSLPQAVLGLIG